MGKNIITFGDIEVVKEKFHHFKSPILVGIESVNKVIVSNKIPFYKKGFKYFVGYKDDRKVKSLCVMLPKMSAYQGDFDESISICIF